MQRYENKTNEQGVAKRILLEFLDYLRYKVENDKLTMEEIEGFSKILQENLPLSGTIADFASYYKKPEVNVARCHQSATDSKACQKGILFLQRISQMCPRFME